jgi:hypothetical protein
LPSSSWQRCTFFVTPLVPPLAASDGFDESGVPPDSPGAIEPPLMAPSAGRAPSCETPGGVEPRVPSLLPCATAQPQNEARRRRAIDRIKTSVSRGALRPRW